LTVFTGGRRVITRRDELLAAEGGVIIKADGLEAEAERRSHGAMYTEACNGGAARAAEIEGNERRSVIDGNT
jgi:hypothetical protein